LPDAAAVAERVPGADAHVAVSALQGTGIDALRTHLLEAAGFQRGNPGTLSARRRHLEALAAAGVFLEAADVQCRGARAAELVAEELRNAQQALGEITGAGAADELLGRIFASFCIGK
jgi:tRNA modification GTPase